jgi:hypothetical protein
MQTALYRRMAALAVIASCLLFISCVKNIKPVISSTTTKPRMLAGGSVVMPNLNISSVNFSDVLYYYAGYYGPNGTYSAANQQTGYQMLSAIAASGIKSIRFFAAGSYCEGCIDYPVVELWKSNRAAYYQAFDQLVSDANSLGIQLIPSLVTGFYDKDELSQAGAPCNIPNFLLGSIPFMASIKKGPGCPCYDCVADPGNCKNRTGMIQYALDIVGRYSNSPTILFWEIGNEINLIRKSRNPDSLFVSQQQIADYVNSLSQQMKAIDPYHPICAGIINDYDQGIDIPGYFNFYYSQLPYIDIATVHLYEGNTAQFYSQPVATVLKSFNDLSQQNGKTLYIGECGVAGGTSWAGANNFNNYVMSLLLAKSYLNVPLASPWDWGSRNNGYNVNNNHPEMLQFSIDPGADDDLISMIKWNNLFMWNEAIQTSTPIVGDFDGDHNTDIGVMTQRGLWQIAPMNNYAPSIPFQWLNNFGDSHADPGGAPFTPITGDWNGDGFTDIGLKSKDGRWFLYFSDRTTRRFINPAQYLSGFGNDYADPGGAPFIPITGDWNGDGYTDIGLKSKDGRWFLNFFDPIGNRYFNGAQYLSNFGNDNADPGGAPFIPITGDWNGDGYTDIGLKSKDGRWFVNIWDPVNNQFINGAQWLSNFGNDYTDPGGAPFIPITGDWNGDGKTDIGLKSKDGRWFVAFSDPVNHTFSGQVQWLTGFGNDYTDPGGAPFIPVTGNWNGDSFTDIGLKSSDGRWFTYICTGSGFTAPRQLFQ